METNLIKYQIQESRISLLFSWISLYDVIYPFSWIYGDMMNPERLFNHLYFDDLKCYNFFKKGTKQQILR